MEITHNIFYSSIGKNEEQFESFDSNVYIDTLQVLKNEIDSYTDLGNNWDGYGGVALLPNISIKAKEFISILDSYYIDKISDMFPTPHGTVTIEWSNETEEKLSLEIGEKNYSYFLEFNNSNPSFYNGMDLPNLEEFNSQLCGLFKNEHPKLSVFR